MGLQVIRILLFNMNYLDSILQSFGARTSGTPTRKIERAMRFIEHEEKQAAQTLANLKNEPTKRSHDQMTYDEPIAYRTRSQKAQEPPAKKQRVEPVVHKPVTRSQTKDAIAYRTRSHY